MLQIRCYERWDMSFAAKWIWDLLNMIQLFTSSYDAWKMMAFDALLLFSHSVVSDSWHHELQHANLPCPSPSPGDCSNSYPLSKWCHPTISSPVVPFSSRFQSFPASGYFPMSQFFTSSIGASASASVLPMNIQDWFPLGLTSLNSLQSKGLSTVFSNTTL